jgi:hypothetical protein
MTTPPPEQRDVERARGWLDREFDAHSPRIVNALAALLTLTRQEAPRADA